MRCDIREAAGLGSPPSIFTTNSSESLNASVKRKVDYKQHEWPQFNKLIKDFVLAQRDEVTRSLPGRGQYRLAPEFSYLATSISEWSKMTPDQRKMVADFDSAAVAKGSACCAVPTSASSVASNDNPSSVRVSVLVQRTLVFSPFHSSPYRVCGIKLKDCYPSRVESLLHQVVIQRPEWHCHLHLIHPTLSDAKQLGSTCVTLLVSDGHLLVFVVIRWLWLKQMVNS